MHRPSRRTVLFGAAGTLAAAGTLTGGTTAGADPRLPCGPVPPEPVPPQAPAREAYLELPDARLWYWDSGGRGPAIVLSHPGSGSALSWPYQQPFFARAGYRVIAYSRRGHYNSSPPDPANPGVGAHDLHALVNHLGLGKFHLLGAAFGGYFATDYALLHPERLHSLTILSSFMGITDPEYLRLTRSLRPPGFNDMPHSFLELCPTYRAGNEEGTRLWTELSDRGLGGHDIPGQTLANTITWPVLETLSVRTLLMTGDADLYWPPPILRMVATHIPSAPTVIFNDAGHAANWERPTAFNHTLLRFLSNAHLPRESCL